MGSAAYTANQQPEEDFDTDMCAAEGAVDAVAAAVAAKDAAAAAAATATATAAAATECVPSSDADADMKVDAGTAKTQLHTVAIFDWDDTLLASTWLRENNLALGMSVPADIAEQLSTLAESVHQLLTRAMEHGHVVIITNAETGWVELSAKTFMPSLLPLLQKLRVVSARSTFEPVFPDSPMDWKLQAFEQEIFAAYGGHKAAMVASAAVKNVLSFGDSMHERTALYNCTNKLSSVLAKSIKFVERPSLQQLKVQVEIVNSYLDTIAHHNWHLDLKLTISTHDAVGVADSVDAGKPAHK